MLDDEAAAAAAAADPLRAQNLSLRVPGTAVYALGDAVAVYQRLGDQIDDWCFTGLPSDAAALLRTMYAEHGHDSGSVPAAALPALEADLTVAEVETWDFRWTDVVPNRTSAVVAAWLRPEEDDDVRALLAVAFPTAALQPGAPEVLRWAGVRDEAGRLVACAADATTCPSMGFITSIASTPEARRRGYGAAVTRWLTAQLVDERGRAALWVHHVNEPARRLYDALGYRDDHWMAWLLVT